MVKAKGEICSQILESQRKIASLESDSSTLSQTLELIQQERVGLSAKLMEKRTFYLKVTEDMNFRLQEQKDCFNSLMTSMEAAKHGTVKDKFDDQTDKTEGEYCFDNLCTADHPENDTRKNLMAKLDSAKAKLAEISEAKLKIIMENKMMKQAIEQVNCRANDLKPELMEMDLKTLEEEYNALLSDKAGETEYLQSLQYQVEKLEGISHVVKCACGEEYRLKTDLCA
ncbi:tropomyosin [Trema orientale]|uniref:Tropomyosin n=1 Tax=Trema orientale TaxID=63057 RepID=A0A2P5FBL7_TREOI|nr:tropomyosin [Trema orientale]